MGLTNPDISHIMDFKEDFTAAVMAPVVSLPAISKVTYWMASSPPLLRWQGHI
jgi:hypothetical protein